MADTEGREIAAQLKILRAAEEIFAEKGYDGARVDEIAKRAGVNKALIYYYYESKEQILEELSKKHLQEMVDSKEKMIRGTNLEQGLSRETVADFIESTLATLSSERKNFFNIVLVEALKRNGDTAFFKLVNQMYDDGLARMSKLGYEVDGDKLKLLAVFFGIIPLVFFITMHEKWAEFNGINKEKAHTDFVEALTDFELNMFLKLFDRNINHEMMEAFYENQNHPITEAKSHPRSKKAKSRK